VVGSEVAMSKYRCLAGIKGSEALRMNKCAGNFDGKADAFLRDQVVRSSRRASISARAC
jgi:hypothetical protein